MIAQKVENEKVVGGDETGTKVNEKNGWFWTFQRQTGTYITFSNNRGTTTIDKKLPNGFINSKLVHDCWRSCFQTKRKTHQMHISHLLRELVFFEERYETRSRILHKNYFKYPTDLVKMF